MTKANETIPEWETIHLMKPIKRGETVIDKFDLRLPNAVDLLGLSLPSIISLETDAVVNVVTRCSNPAITEAEVYALPAGDITEICGAIRGFFMTRAERTARGLPTTIA
ncbi:phage tail assembly protein [Novosphingobium umbonatum]|uniref:Phage tail assembly protein n=1 Tax=Novosphingobium umbonatum TaxID=1908524 RepID=A0A437N1X6_9SPHN|nr:phage tail assembly protein [Novosphingobium umbonatum]RVU03919.1 phage tail assembly protein [Novosphingobium umbonatum]